MNKYTNITFNNNLLIWINLRNSLWTIWTCLHCNCQRDHVRHDKFQINENTFNKWIATFVYRFIQCHSQRFLGVFDCFLVHSKPITITFSNQFVCQNSKNFFESTWSQVLFESDHFHYYLKFLRASMGSFRNFQKPFPHFCCHFVPSHYTRHQVAEFKFLRSPENAGYGPESICLFSMSDGSLSVCVGLWHTRLQNHVHFQFAPVSMGHTDDDNNARFVPMQFLRLNYRGVLRRFGHLLQRRDFRWIVSNTWRTL